MTHIGSNIQLQEATLTIPTSLDFKNLRFQGGTAEPQEIWTCLLPSMTETFEYPNQMYNESMELLEVSLSVNEKHNFRFIFTDEVLLSQFVLNVASLIIISRGKENIQCGNKQYRAAILALSQGSNTSNTYTLRRRISIEEYDPPAVIEKDDPPPNCMSELLGQYPIDFKENTDQQEEMYQRLLKLHDRVIEVESESPRLYNISDNDDGKICQCNTMLQPWQPSDCARFMQVMIDFSRQNRSVRSMDENSVSDALIGKPGKVEPEEAIREILTVRESVSFREWIKFETMQVSILEVTITSTGQIIYFLCQELEGEADTCFRQLIQVLVPKVEKRALKEVCSVNFLTDDAGALSKATDWLAVLRLSNNSLKNVKKSTDPETITITTMFGSFDIRSFFPLSDWVTLLTFCENQKAKWSVVNVNDQNMKLPRQPTGVELSWYAKVKHALFDEFHDVLEQESTGIDSTDKTILTRFDICGSDDSQTMANLMPYFMNQRSVLYNSATAPNDSDGVQTDLCMGSMQNTRGRWQFSCAFVFGTTADEVPESIRSKLVRSVCSDSKSEMPVDPEKFADSLIKYRRRYQENADSLIKYKRRYQKNVFIGETASLTELTTFIGVDGQTKGKIVSQVGNTIKVEESPDNSGKYRTFMLLPKFQETLQAVEMAFGIRFSNHYTKHMQANLAIADASEEAILQQAKLDAKKIKNEDTKEDFPAFLESYIQKVVLKNTDDLKYMLYPEKHLKSIKWNYNNYGFRTTPKAKMENIAKSPHLSSDIRGQIKAKLDVKTLWDEKKLAEGAFEDVMMKQSEDILVAIRRHAKKVLEWMVCKGIQSVWDIKIPYIETLNQSLSSLDEEQLLELLSDDKFDNFFDSSEYLDRGYSPIAATRIKVQESFVFVKAVAFKETENPVKVWKLSQKIFDVINFPQVSFYDDFVTVMEKYANASSIEKVTIREEFWNPPIELSGVQEAV